MITENDLLEGPLGGILMSQECSAEGPSASKMSLMSLGCPWEGPNVPGSVPGVPGMSPGMS